jgi:ribosomal protein L14
MLIYRKKEAITKEIVMLKGRGTWNGQRLGEVPARNSTRIANVMIHVVVTNSKSERRADGREVNYRTQAVLIHSDCLC